MRSIWVTLGLCLGIAAIWPNTSEAACYGSGKSWTCPAGSTIADVNTAIGTASDGATITFVAGTYDWSGGTISLSNYQGITLACESQASCFVTQGTNTMIELLFSGTNTKLYRITGFAFTQTGGATCGMCIWFYGAGTLTQFRIDHNSWTGYTEGSALTFFGANDRAGYFYGLIDHNTVNATNDNFIAKILGHNYGNQFTTASPQVRGTGNNIFVEDNTFNITNGFSATACIDTHQQAAFVTRYNSMTNCRGLDTHGVPHGGVNNWEAYRNSFIKTNGMWDDCLRCFLNQGSGQWYVWDNSFTPVGPSVNASAIALLHHRSNPDAPGIYGICDGTKPVDGNTSPGTIHFGYPCLAQPGRMEAGGTPRWGKLSPIAVFLNRSTKDGSKVDLLVGSSGGPPDYVATHLRANRDYYNAVSANPQISPTSPFNGTVGIGHGTLANRPTTCTHTTAPDGDEGGGVMYWATDQGSWNQSGDGRGSGILYRCSAPNTWSVHYTPYIYPHPLQALVAGSGDLAAPDSPRNVQVK